MSSSCNRVSGRRIGLESIVTYTPCGANDRETSALTLNNEARLAARVVPRVGVRDRGRGEVGDRPCSGTGIHVDVRFCCGIFRHIVCGFGDGDYAR